MKHLEELNLLIDQASSIAGNDRKLALMLGVPREHLSNWRHDKRTATPMDQALMAHVAGLCPVRELVMATLKQYEGKPKRLKLLNALENSEIVDSGFSYGASQASADAYTRPDGIVRRSKKPSFSTMQPEDVDGLIPKETGVGVQPLKRSRAGYAAGERHRLARGL